MINQMSKSIILTFEQWAAIRQKIANDYPRSVWLIREKTRAVLGFTVRDHEEWVDDLTEGRCYTKRCIATIHLDFYNEPKRTMFLLRYSEIINELNV
jgi:hypothetical protein